MLVRHVQEKTHGLRPLLHLLRREPFLHLRERDHAVRQPDPVSLIDEHRIPADGHDHRAGLHLHRLVVPRNVRGKRADMPAEPDHLRATPNVDVQSSAHRAQHLFRSALCIVQMGELSESSTQFRSSLDHRHRHTEPGQGQRRLHPRRPAADDQHALLRGDFDVFEGHRMPNLSQRHLDEGARLLSGSSVRMHPSALLSDIRHGAARGISSRRLQHIGEDALISLRRTRGHDCTVQLLLRNPIAHRVSAFVRTEHLSDLDMRDVRSIPKAFRQARQIYRL